MLSSYISQIILERFADLPELLQDSLEPDILQERLYELTKRYSLSTLDSIKIENELVLVLLALEPYNDLARNIANELGVAMETIHDIVQDIAVIFFTPNIRATLDAIYLTRDQNEALAIRQKWLDSDAPRIIGHTLVEDLHLNPARVGPLINIVGDTVLGLIPVDDLPEHIHATIGVPLPLGQLIAEHLLVLLAQAHALPQTHTAPSPQPPAVTPEPVQPPAPAPQVVTPAEYYHTPAPASVAPPSASVPPVTLPEPTSATPTMPSQAAPIPEPLIPPVIQTVPQYQAPTLTASPAGMTPEPYDMPIIQTPPPVATSELYTAPAVHVPPPYAPAPTNLPTASTPQPPPYITPVVTPESIPPVAAPPAWGSARQTETPPATAAPHTPVVETPAVPERTPPPTSPVMSYQKPLTSVPQYKNPN